MRDKRHVSLGRGKIEIYCKIKFLTINEIFRCKIDDPHTLLIPHFALRPSSAPLAYIISIFHVKSVLCSSDPCYFSVFSVSQTLLSRRATIDCFLLLPPICDISLVCCVYVSHSTPTFFCKVQFPIRFFFVLSSQY